MKKLTLIERMHFLHRRLRYAHRTEPDTIRFIRDFVSRGDYVLDIGANRGIVTWFLAQAAGIEGKVIAFEPQPELIPVLNAVKETFGLHQLSIVNKGLAESPGVLDLYREYAGSTGSTLGATRHTKESIPVQVVPLDVFLYEEWERTGGPAEQRSKVSFVKCDVDGFERQVFSGATQMLSSDRPILLIEINETDKPSMCELLAAHGYHDFWFRFRNRIYAGQMSSQIAFHHSNAHYRNFLFMHDSDPRRAMLEEFERHQ